MPDGNCDVNATDSNLDKDNGFQHVDNVADAIYSNGAVSHKYNYY
jgi:hypothetical protein